RDGDAADLELVRRRHAASSSQRSFQGRACSYAYAACNTRSPRRRGPTICRPAGNPASVNPARTLAAGWPEKLNGYVNATAPSADRIGSDTVARREGTPR